MPLAAIPGSYVWHEYRDQDDTQVYLIELAATLSFWEPDEVSEDEGASEGISKELLSLRRAEYNRLIKRATAGSVTDEGWNPAGKDPVVWELKLDYDGLLFRFIFAEPGRLPGRMIGLLPHVKKIFATPEATRDAQTTLISSATNRYSLGESWDWGMPLSEPLAGLNPFDRMRRET